MKQIFTTIVLLFMASFYYNSQAQCMLKPLPLTQRIAPSSHIVEGVIINKECIYSNQQQSIFTKYTISVGTVLKGVNTPATLQFVDEGGIINLEKVETTIQTDIPVGTKGVFFLTPTNDAFDASLQYLELVGGPQGFIQYNAKTATDVFFTYNNTQTEIIDAIANNTNTNISLQAINNLPKQTRDKTTTNNNPAEAVDPAGSVTSLTPALVVAGNKQVITITGTGFGATRGTSNVYFANANNGGTNLVAPSASQYISWSNTQIKVQVPSIAGSGIVYVSDGTNFLQSPTNLVVKYALSNVAYNVGGVDSFFLSKHVNKNTAGGYSFKYFTGFANNANATTDFANALQAWRCAIGINWVVSASTTTINTSAGDAESVVRFDVGGELALNVLGVAASRYQGCAPAGVGFKWFVNEVDVTFDDATNWYYTSGSAITNSQSDFYSVAIHELGHGIQLGHVTDANRIMYYASTTGTQNRNITPLDDEGGTYMMAYAVTGAPCNQATHVPINNAPTATTTFSAPVKLESAGIIVCTISLNAPACDPVTIAFTNSGTATLGVDYTIAPSTIVIPSGNSSTTFTISIIDDSFLEGDETIDLSYSSLINGTAAAIPISSFSILDDEIVPLAIQNILLQAKNKQIGNLLTWQLPNQNQVEEYKIYHSNTGNNFTFIASQKEKNAAGNYAYLHPLTSIGNHFYKVEAVDNTNTIVQTSATVLVSNNQNVQTISVHPNPSKGLLTILANTLQAAPLQIVIVDVTGKKVFQKEISCTAGSNQIPVDCTSLQNGFYTIQLWQNAEQLLKEKMLIHKL